MSTDETKAKLEEAADIRTRVRNLLARILAADEGLWLPTAEETAFVDSLGPWAGVQLPGGGTSETDHIVGFLQRAEYALDEAVNRLIHELAGTVTKCSECGRSLMTPDPPTYEISLNRPGASPTFVRLSHEVIYCIDGCKLHFLCAFKGQPARYQGYHALNHQLDPCPSSHAFWE